jgi:hypothetical protein
MKKLLILFAISFFAKFTHAQDSLQQFTGRYVFEAGSPVQEVEVVLTDTLLSMNSAAGNASLLKLGVDSFQVVEFSGTAVFKRDKDNKVISVHIEAMGYTLVGQKQNAGTAISFSFAIKREDWMLNKEQY